MSWSSVELLKAVLCIAGIAVLIVRHYLLQHSLYTNTKGLRFVMLGLAGAGVAAYFNFGMFHWTKYPDTIHYYDFYHYYIGAKYFPELGYKDLYLATIAADGHGEDYFYDAGVRRVRNLVTNQRISLKDAIAQSADVKSRFATDRWDEFVNDIGFFQEHMPRQHWKNIVSDLGFNGTPVWLLGGRVMSSLGASDQLSMMVLLAWVDVILLAVGFCFFYHAFGLDTLCIALLFFGVNYFGRFQHIGGSFLRYDWLAFLLIALSLLKLRHPYWAGATLAYSCLLRIFPILFFAGAGVRVFYLVWQKRQVWTEDLRVLIGGALGGGLLVALSCIQPGGIQAWQAFRDDIIPHHDRLSVKRVALIYPFVYGGEVNDADMKAVVGEESWSSFYRWRERRIAQWTPAIWILRIVLVWVFARACVRLLCWEAICLSGLLIFVLLNPVRYYYAYLIVLIPMFLLQMPRRPSIVSLCALFALMIVEYTIDQTTRFYNIHQFVQSLLLGLIVSYVFVEYARQPTRAIQEGEDAQPSRECFDK